eukprot:gene1692-2036_t
MSGLRPVLLGAGQGLQLLACQVIAAVALQAPAQLLQQLMLHEACELLFEVVRGTLASCSMAPQLLASAAVWNNGSLAEVAADEEQEAVYLAALTCLQCLAKQGSCFLEHLHFGIEALTCLLQHCTQTANSPIMAQVLLLFFEVTGPRLPPSLLLPQAAVVKLAAAAADVLPDCESHTAGSFTAVTEASTGPQLQPSPELQDAYVGACRALAALNILSTSTLLAGFLPASCQLAQAVAELLLRRLDQPPAALAQPSASGPFCQQLIGQGHCWTSVTLASLETLPFLHQQQQQQVAEGAWQDVLTALDAVVAAAGPGMLSQGDLLVGIMALYSMAERQHAAELS